MSSREGYERATELELEARRRYSVIQIAAAKARSAAKEALCQARADIYTKARDAHELARRVRPRDAAAEAQIERLAAEMADAAKLPPPDYSELDAIYNATCREADLVCAEEIRAIYKARDRGEYDKPAAALT